MRICLVSLDFAPFRSSGLAVYAENLARGLTKEGHEVTVIASGPRDDTLQEMQRYASRVFRIPLGPSNWIGYAYNANKALQAIQRETIFDIVHFLDVHFAYAYRGPFVASLFQSFRQRLTAMGKLPYSSSMRNLVFRYVYYNLAKAVLETPSLKKASCLIAASCATKDEFVTHYQVDEHKIQVVSLGVDTDFFRRRDARQLRERLNIKDENTVLYVGFSTPRKGLEYLGQALSLLERDVKLIIVGRWEKGYRQKFLRAAGDEASRIIEAGYVEDEEMPFYYSLADVVVLPSLLEGFGLPLVEAMACSTPVVATDVGSIPEVVGNAGILVPPTDHEALADGIKRILNEGTLRRQLGLAGKERARKYFSRDRMAADTLAAYRGFVREQDCS
ncbi:MAG: glycosyltransferase family 4 protein [Anaerolineae bacterium]